jgi:hypothetical protein
MTPNLKFGVIQWRGLVIMDRCSINIGHRFYIGTNLTGTSPNRFQVWLDGERFDVHIGRRLTRVWMWAMPTVVKVIRFGMWLAGYGKS